jgi:hypothetical protein
MLEGNLIPSEENVAQLCQKPKVVRQVVVEQPRLEKYDSLLSFQLPTSKEFSA